MLLLSFSSFKRNITGFIGLIPLIRASGGMVDALP